MESRHAQRPRVLFSNGPADINLLLHQPAKTVVSSFSGASDTGSGSNNGAAAAADPDPEPPTVASLSALCLHAGFLSPC